MISPVVKACDAIFGTPTVTPSIPTDTPSPTGTIVPITQTPTPTPAPTTGEFFNLHPFIKAHPEAVFISGRMYLSRLIRTDLIGAWLTGHEPGNFGFFHIAKERGLSNVVNPRDIPVYLWDNSGPQRMSLDDFEHVPLLTNYLRRDYNGQTEEQYHLVDEPFHYAS